MRRWGRVRLLFIEDGVNIMLMGQLKPGVNTLCPRTCPTIVQENSLQQAWGKINNFLIGVTMRHRCYELSMTCNRFKNVLAFIKSTSRRSQQNYYLCYLTTLQPRSIIPYLIQSIPQTNHLLFLGRALSLSCCTISGYRHALKSLVKRPQVSSSCLAHLYPSRHQQVQSTSVSFSNLIKYCQQVSWQLLPNQPKIKGTSKLRTQSCQLKTFYQKVPQELTRHSSTTQAGHENPQICPVQTSLLGMRRRIG